MVQKITNYTGNFSLSANFEPTAISGLTISHSGGAIVGDGVIAEIAAGNIVVPNNATWTVYVDTGEGTFVSAPTSAVPTSNVVVQWAGVSSGGATTFTDLRSWASTSNVIAETQGFNEYLTTQFNMNYDWRLNESSGNNNEDFGTEVDVDMTNDQPAGTTINQTGDVSYETDRSVFISGGGGARIANTSGIAFSSTLPNTGHVGIVCKTNTASTNSFSVGDIMFCHGSSATNAFMFIRGSGSGASTTMEVRFFNIPTGYEAHTRCQTTPNLDDDEFHLYVIDQRGDGNGPYIYVDGVLRDNTSAGSFTNYAVGGTADDWWDESPTAGRAAIGSACALGNNIWDGNFSRVWISEDNVTDAQMTKLNDARTAEVAV